MRQYVRERLGDSSGGGEWIAQDKITGELVSSVFLTLFNLQLFLRGSWSRPVLPIKRDYFRIHNIFLLKA